MFIGWLALKPLFETFGLTTIADTTGWLLIGAVAVGNGQLANSLYRSGYASAGLVVLLAVLALVGRIGYAIVIGTLAPALRSPEATLNLTVLAFIAGVPAYGAMTILPVAAHRQRLAPILAVRWHLAVIAYAQAVTLLIGFLLLSLFGMA